MDRGTEVSQIEVFQIKVFQHTPIGQAVVVRQLLQLCVLCFGFFEDRNIGVGVFPEG
jgi:hypothetical protein